MQYAQIWPTFPSQTEDPKTKNDKKRPTKASVMFTPTSATSMAPGADQRLAYLTPKKTVVEFCAHCRAHGTWVFHKVSQVETDSTPICDLRANHLPVLKKNIFRDFWDVSMSSDASQTLWLPNICGIQTAVRSVRCVKVKVLHPSRYVHAPGRFLPRKPSTDRL